MSSVSFGLQQQLPQENSYNNRQASNLLITNGTINMVGGTSLKDSDAEEMFASSEMTTMPPVARPFISASAEPRMIAVSVNQQQNDESGFSGLANAVIRKTHYE